MANQTLPNNQNNRDKKQKEELEKALRSLWLSIWA